MQYCDVHFYCVWFGKIIGVMKCIIIVTPLNRSASSNVVIVIHFTVPKTREKEFTIKLYLFVESPLF